MRSLLYKAARLLGDWNAIIKPTKIPKRIANKLIGRYMGRFFMR